MTDAQERQLQSLIEALGVTQLLSAIADQCATKAEEATDSWAAYWSRTGTKIDRLAVVLEADEPGAKRA